MSFVQRKEEEEHRGQGLQKLLATIDTQFVSVKIGQMRQSSLSTYQERRIPAGSLAKARHVARSCVSVMPTTHLMILLSTPVCPVSVGRR